LVPLARCLQAATVLLDTVTVLLRFCGDGSKQNGPQ